MVNLILKMNELTLEIYPFNMKKNDLSGTAKDEISRVVKWMSG